MHLGEYELIERIGQGGMGVIFKARQVRLNRMVAVKMIQAGVLASPELVRRFQTEAEAAACLDHPHIVAIYEVGECQGQHYYSMRLVEGPNLAQELGRRGRFPPREAAALVATVARAVHYAHQHGVLHRDLKPANILLGAEGQPQVTDFGLAKLRSGASALTVTGDTLGTPNYIPPEQAAGRLNAVGPRSDIYSLGAMLYHLLAGRPPFLAETVVATLREVQETDPVALRLLNPLVPRDLETICQKCLEKDPGSRFATAEELADDLDRYLAGEPIRSRPVGLWGRGGRWCRRNPRLAVLWGAVALLVAVVAVGTPVLISRIARERSAAVRSAEAAQLGLYRLELTRVEDLLGDGRSAEAVALLAALVRRNPRDEAVAERLVNELTQRSFALPTLNPLVHADRVFDARFSLDGSRILTVCRDNAARVWDTCTGALSGAPLQHDPLMIRSGEFLGPVQPMTARFSTDGLRVVTASVDRTVRLWDALTGQPVTPFPPQDGAFECLHFNPKGSRFATGGADGSVQVWEAYDGRRIGDALHVGGAVEGIEFSRDSRWLVCWFKDGTARVWDTSAGVPVGPVRAHAKEVRTACFSPDGRHLATGSGDATARIWRVDTGEPTSPSLVHGERVNTVRFSPDGLRIVTASFDHTARIWSAPAGQPIGRVLQHRGIVRSAEFSPEGARVVTASEDGTARLWDARTGEPLTEPLRHHGAVWSAAFSPEGEKVITASSDRTVRVWDTRPGGAEVQVMNLGVKVFQVHWSADGESLLTIARDSITWNREGRWLARGGLRGSPHQAVWGQLSADNRRALVARGNAAEVWDLRTGAATPPPLQHTGTVHMAVFSPDGSRVVTASADRTARIWNVKTGAAIGLLLQHADTVYSAEFSPDGQRVVTGCADGSAQLWDAGTGQRLAQWRRHSNEVVSARFSRDGARVVTASEDGTAVVWDVGSGRSVGRALRHDDGIRSAVFNPDGTRVLTASRDGTARLWDTETGLPATDDLSHDGAVTTAGFSADGRRVATASEDGTARLWCARTGQPVSSPLRHQTRVSHVEFSPDGRFLATASGVYARVWEVARVVSPAPDWLPGLAEAVVGLKVDEHRRFESVPVEVRTALAARVEATTASGPWFEWARWFLADRVERAVSPGSQITVRDRILRHLDVSRRLAPPACVQELREALWYQPSHEDLIACLARMLLKHARPDDPGALLEGDFLSRYALSREPDEPDPLWARALYLERAGDMAAALEAIDRATRSRSADAHVWLAQAQMLERAGQLDAALRSLSRSVEAAVQAGWNQEDYGDVLREQAAFLKRTGESGGVKGGGDPRETAR